MKAMLQLSRKRTASYGCDVTVLWIAVVVAFVMGGCARTTVLETVTPYQGEPVEGVSGLTFDGDQFVLPDGDRIPRDETQTIQFAAPAKDSRQAGDRAGSEGLTPLAQGLIERGSALARQYLGVPGVMLVDDGIFESRKDGTSLYSYHFAGLVLKEEAKAWAQFSAGFTEGRSRVNVLFARSVGPDGVVHTLSPDALQTGSPSESMQFFNPNRKVLSGVIPGVEIGSVVEYAYEFERYNPENPKMFFPGFFFQGDDPVVLSRVKVTVPRNTPFHHVTRRFPDAAKAEPVIERTGGSVSYTWTLEDSPPLAQEPYMPPQRDLVPMMEGSIFEDFDAVFALQRDLQLDRMKLTPEIETLVKELTADATSVDDQLAALYHWVQTNTRYVSIKGSLGAGWSGHTAQETFANRYGDCTDKGVLFATMCKAIGVESYPIILLTNDAGTGITEIPTLDGNHCINEVVLKDGRSFYLDTTAQNFRYPYFRSDDHDAFAINAVRGDVKRIPVPPPEDNGRESHLAATLEPNGDVSVKTRNTYAGTYEAGVRGYWKQVREDNRKLRMTEYVNSISPGAVLEDFTLSDLDTLSQQLTMTMDYALPGHAIRAKDLMYLRMPTLEQTFPEAALETRQFPVQYTTTEQRRLVIDLKLPEGFRAKWTPPPLDISSPYLEYHAAYEPGEGGIRLEQTFRQLKRIVPVEDYPQYRDDLRAIAAFTKKEIFVSDEGR